MGLPRHKRHTNGEEFASLIRDILAFRDERDWAQFHSPRNLAAALAIETSELQELMLWKTDEQTKELLKSARGHELASHEIADILIYALLFCEAVGIEPGEAVRGKLIANARNYPAEAARGKAIKYTQLLRLDQEGSPNDEGRDPTP